MNGLAIAAFVLAVVGLCSPIAILGLILGYVAKGQIKRRNNSGEGLAKAAIILGWISIVLFILLVVLGITAGTFTDWEQWKQDWDKEYN
jgi:ABC-type Fe3+ transport system permease subunit